MFTDPLSCLSTYFNKTSQLVQHLEKQPVFPTLNPPFRGISAQTVAQILNNSIKDAGLPVGVYSAKSFRPSSATAAVVTGCDLNSARIRDRWKDYTTFFFANYVYPV